MKQRVIEKTADGSDTLFIPEINEHYHSVKGALTETQYIFIECALLAHPSSTLKVLEVGFGTGLNALQTLEAAQHNKRFIDYHTIEKYPLTIEEIEQLNFSSEGHFHALHQAPWEEKVQITPYFAITKHLFDFTQLAQENIGKGYDVVYFDAFAPEKQPSMWTSQLFEQIYVLLNKEAILTTYCAKGVIRRMLQNIGFTVERLPGPPDGKREILRATKH